MLKKIFALSVCLLSLAARAEAAPISTIQVQGNQRIEARTVESYMAIKTGDEPDSALINKSLKQLFATGLFSDIRIRQDGTALIVIVNENPIINRVAFEGNKRIEDKDLEVEVQLRPRSVYTKTRLRDDVERIQNIYHKSGRFAAKITPKVIQLSQNRIDLVFEIDEGPKAAVKRIDFVGNVKFSDKALRKVLQTKEKRWYRFFSSSDSYDADRLSFDKELLRKYYIARGYADFQVTSTNVELNADKDAFFITFTLEEGEKYNFGTVDVKSSLPNVKEADFTPVLKTKSGETFNAELVEKTIEAMVGKLSDAGYAFVAVDPQFTRKQKEKLMDVTYNIQEGAKVYVDNINIHGNVRTMDEVVRREFRLEEGDPYNAALIRRSRERIRNLGFFDKVDIKNVRDEKAPDKMDIDVQVSERSTGELNFGAGYSTSEGALANTSIRERNLLGRGQDLKLTLQAAERGLQADLGFTEPYFMDREIAAGFDVFSITRDRRLESSYDSKTQGVTLRAGYALSEYLQHALRYSVRTDEITNVTDDASRFIKDQEGENMTSAIGHSFTYDRRDNRFDPRNGYYWRFNQEFAGVGGDSQYVRNELRGAYYMPVMRDDVVLQLSAKAGNIFGWGSKDVRINERFFVGGDDLRGFRSGGIGPRDIDTKDALGGDNYYTFGPELTFPLGLPDELGVRGALFMDAGSLFGVDDTGPEVVDESSLRVAVGGGVAWGSPLGPIRVDVGFPIKKEDFDREQNFRLNFGTRF